MLAKTTSKRGRYYVNNHFLRFYYRFIVPQLSAIERDYHEATAATIQAELRAFLGMHSLEELCREWIWAAAMSGQLDFAPEVVGS